MPTQPLHSYLLICEHVLQEHETNVFSAVRIVDIFFVPKLPEDIPAQYGALQLTVLYNCVLPPEDMEPHHIELFMDRPSGETVKVANAKTQPMPKPILPNAPKSINLTLKFKVLPKEEGLHVLRVVIDRSHTTKTTFTLTPQLERPTE